MTKVAHLTTSPTAKTTKTVRSRAATPAGQRLHDLASYLQRFFGSQTDLATALGTSRDTLRSWLSDSPPARPRAELVGRLETAVRVCKYVCKFMDDDVQVGAWLLAPQPALWGSSPAEVLREGDPVAVEALGGQLVALRPKVPSGPATTATAEELRSRMAQRLDADTMAQIDAHVDRSRQRRKSPEQREAAIKAAMAEG